MSTLVRTTLAALVLVTVTAAPAAAAPVHPTTESAPYGLCRLWPKLCA